MSVGEPKRGSDARRPRSSMQHDSAVRRRERSVPGDRELARSSPAFMVVNWTVKDGKMGGV
jgi:hypothetical protein